VIETVVSQPLTQDVSPYVLDRDAILARIPHGQEFCYVDKVEIVFTKEDPYAIGTLLITPEHCRGHFSSEKGFRQVFPKVLGEEAAAQTGLVLATVLVPQLIGRAATFVNETTCTTMAPIVPGPTLTMEVWLVSAVSQLQTEFVGEAVCRARVGRTPVFEATFGFAFPTQEQFNRMVAIYERKAHRK